MLAQLNEDRVFELYQSTVEFPIDFEEAWIWLGFSRKDKGKQSLLVSGAIEGVDFIFLPLEGEFLNHAGLSPQEQAAASRSEEIWLTVDCFKAWAMQVKTKRGKEVRKYFLNCEKKLKQIQTNIRSTNTLKTRDLNQEQIYFLEALLTEKELNTVLVDAIYQLDEYLGIPRDMFDMPDSVLTFCQARQDLLVFQEKVDLKMKDLRSANFEDKHIQEFAKIYNQEIDNLKRQIMLHELDADEFDRHLDLTRQNANLLENYKLIGIMGKD